MHLVNFTYYTVNLVYLFKKRAHLMKWFCIYVRTLVEMHKSSIYKKQNLVQLSIYNVWECNRWNQTTDQYF